MNWSLVRVYIVVEDSPNHIAEGHRPKASSLIGYVLVPESRCPISIIDDQKLPRTDWLRLASFFCPLAPTFFESRQSLLLRDGRLSSCLVQLRFDFTVRLPLYDGIGHARLKSFDSVVRLL